MNGYLPHHVVKAVVFWVLTASIVIVTIAGVLLKWGTIGEEMAYRCFWTTFILCLGSVAFLVTNLIFGSVGSELFTGRPVQGPPLDPAFADRLKRAKEFRDEQDFRAD